jgi:hypothetical protein
VEIETGAKADLFPSLKINLPDQYICDQLLGVPETLQGHAKLLFIQEDKFNGWIENGFGRLVKFDSAGDDLFRWRWPHRTCSIRAGISTRAWTRDR